MCRNWRFTACSARELAGRCFTPARAGIFGLRPDKPSRAIISVTDVVDGTADARRLSHSAFARRWRETWVRHHAGSGRTDRRRPHDGPGDALRNTETDAGGGAGGRIG